MKVLMLDNDGVICLNKNWGSRFKKGSGTLKDVSVLQRFDNFDKKAVKVLNEILTETDCEIIVSSDWRRWATVEELGEYYEHQGIIKKPIGFTSFINDIDVPSDFKWIRDFDSEQKRSLEIKDWLNKHPEVTHWVAVDDMFMGITETDRRLGNLWGLEKFVWCPSVYEGINQTGIKEKILKFLS